MNDKIENVLTISMGVSDEELEKSEILGSSYNEMTDLWEIVVKTNSSIKYIQNKYEGTFVEELFAGYGIITTRKEYIDSIASENAIDYVEAPKRIYYNLEYSKLVSCIDSFAVKSVSFNGGEGVIVGIIDSDIEILNSEFIDREGRSRIIRLWNQNDNRIYTQEEIDTAINEKRELATGFRRHGTNVATIACGNSGVAYRSHIVAVALGVSKTNSFPRTLEVMRALQFVVETGIQLNKPVAINLSLGNNYGPHNGNTILESFINELIGVWKVTICIGTGNEGVRGTHFTGKADENETQSVEFTIGEYETSVNLQLWKNYADEFKLALVNPSGKRIEISEFGGEIQRFTADNTGIVAFVGEPSPFATDQEIFFDLIPVNDYIDSGIWRLLVYGKKIVNGTYNMWLPSQHAINNSTGFLLNSPDLTITIPATATKAISVGAYNARNMSIADFSGRGDNKPDIVAPGVNIDINGSLVSGTSFSTPFVTGGAAVLMSWGIVEKNDPFLYGEKVKAYLEKGANELLGIEFYPNNQVGWGALCLDNSII